jgi:hypothetical protein
MKKSLKIYIDSVIRTGPHTTFAPNTFDEYMDVAEKASGMEFSLLSCLSATHVRLSNKLIKAINISSNAVRVSNDLATYRNDRRKRSLNGAMILEKSKTKEDTLVFLKELGRADLMELETMSNKDSKVKLINVCTEFIVNMYINMDFSDIELKKIIPLWLNEVGKLV